MAKRKSSCPMWQLGDKFQKLGAAMKRDDTTIDDLVVLADACGLDLKFAMFPRETQKPTGADAEASSHE